jgi:hypothetical protein
VEFADRGGGFGADGGVGVVGEGATKGVPDGLSIGEGEGHGFFVGFERWSDRGVSLSKRIIT